MCGLATDVDAELVSVPRVTTRDGSEVRAELPGLLALHDEVVEAVDLVLAHDGRGCVAGAAGRREADTRNRTTRGLVADFDAFHHVRDLICAFGVITYCRCSSCAVVLAHVGTRGGLAEDEHVDVLDVDILTTGVELDVGEDCIIRVAGVLRGGRAIDADGEFTSVDGHRGRVVRRDGHLRTVELTVHAVPVQGTDGEEVRALFEVHLDGLISTVQNVGNDFERDLVALQN